MYNDNVSQIRLSIEEDFTIGNTLHRMNTEKTVLTQVDKLWFYINNITYQAENGYKVKPYEGVLIGLGAALMERYAQGRIDKLQLEKCVNLYEQTLAKKALQPKTEYMCSITDSPCVNCIEKYLGCRYSYKAGNIEEKEKCLI